MTSSEKGFKDFCISNEGLTKVLELSKESKYPGQHLMWTDDYRVELPIRLGSQGIERIQPTTIIDEWRQALKKFGDFPALSVKRNNKWVTLNFKQYYGECVKFAKSLIFLGLPDFTAINIIGFNTPEWSIAYMGSIFARCLPVGIYTTNSQSACQYIATHSESRIIVAQNKEYARKYYNLLERNIIDRIIIYDDELEEGKYSGKILKWNDFLKIGESIPQEAVDQRTGRMRPGNCCTLIYTSGTTGMPKGVMLSHDNFIWTSKSALEVEPASNRPLRVISYLPLSHAAAQFIDIFRAFMTGSHIFFADPSALQGSLIQTLQEVKPEGFFSVPRVWEKIYSKMMEMSKSNTGILAKIATWAKSIGQEGTIQEARGQETSFQFKLAKRLVYNNVKKALGLDECIYFIFGSAPLDPVIRKYFFSLNIFLQNGYGMTECTAPQCKTNIFKIDLKKPEDYLEVGTQFNGTQMKIHKLSEQDEQGEICMRGRNICMGYFKNAEETSKTIDEQGFLHSGDIGRMNKDGVLFITGRVKELIITAGGQNIPPILIENEIKNALPCLSNVMAIGDHRKYLTCLVSLKQDPPASGNLQKEAVDFFSSKGCKVKTVKQALNSEEVRKIINEGLKVANNKAISRAQHVQEYYLMAEDFSVENGTLTPTLKLKRKEVMNKYAAEIEAMYSKAKL